MVVIDKNWKITAIPKQHLRNTNGPWHTTVITFISSNKIIYTRIRAREIEGFRDRGGWLCEARTERKKNWLTPRCHSNNNKFWSIQNIHIFIVRLYTTTTTTTKKLNPPRGGMGVKNIGGWNFFFIITLLSLFFPNNNKKKYHQIPYVLKLKYLFE